MSSVGVQARLASMAARRGAVGVQYLVVRDGQVWLEHCHGLADAAIGQPVTPQTTFNAYSITKPFTAAAVMTLAAAGRLDLEAPIGIAAGVEGLEAYGSVRDTLLHRAGFRNPNPLRWIHLAGTHDSFDEAGFVATQRAWGGPFVDALQSLVLEPLHLGAGERLSFAIERPEFHAHGHLRRHGLMDLMLGLFINRPGIVQDIADGWVRLRLHHVNGSAYGGLMANARGLARFGQAVIGNSDGAGSAFEPGWFSGRLGSHRWFAHAGGGLGYYGELRLYPGLGAVSCLLTNGYGLSDARCLDQVDALWLDPPNARS